MPGATNGWHQGTQLFACPERKAVFVPLGHFKLDHRFDDECNNNSSTGLSDYDTFGKVECPVVPGFYPPIEMVDVEKLYGRNKGIQGHKNSCYLDATLFAMFAFTRFDSNKTSMLMIHQATAELEVIIFSRGVRTSIRPKNKNALQRQRQGPVNKIQWTP